MWYYSFPKSKPRQAKGGIKSQSKSGAFGKSWWAQRWIEVLESFDIGARLGRGRSYARKGQVLNIDVAVGKVKADVQGSRPRPYGVAIQVKMLAKGDWQKLVKALSSEVLFTAKLLAGEMPQDIEKVFTEAKLSLFPEKLGDLSTNCSCPDWSNPCKHIAAVYYLLGEEFDRDPFLLFKLRGMDREELMRSLSKNVGQTGTTAQPSQPAPVLPPEPLPADWSQFWAAAKTPDELFGEISIPPVHASLPRQLGSFPFWRGEARFIEALEPVYRAASERGMAAYLGQSQ